MKAPQWFIELSDTWWFKGSPSIITFLYLGIIWFYAFLKAKRFFGSIRGYFSLILEAIFVTGLMVFIMDTIWLTVFTIRFVVFDVYRIYTVIPLSFLRNILAIGLCLSWGGLEWIRSGLMRFPLLSYLLLSVFYIFWMVMAQTPMDADYTLALLNGYYDVAFHAWLMSHVIGRLISLFVAFSWFRRLPHV